MKNTTFCSFMMLEDRSCQHSQNHLGHRKKFFDFRDLLIYTCEWVVIYAFPFLLLNLNCGPFRSIINLCQFFNVRIWYLLMSPFSFLGFNILLLFWKLWAQIFGHFYYSYGMVLIQIKGFIIKGLNVHGWSIKAT